MEKIDYSLAPAGSTHEYHGMWRKVDGHSCLHWSGLQWVYNPPLRVDDYEPIPEREIALNRLADTMTGWPYDKMYCLTLNENNGMQASWIEWQNRRAARIEAGIIKQNNDLADVTVTNYDTKPQEWINGFPPSKIECEFYHADFDRWVRCTTIGMFGNEMVCTPYGGCFFAGKAENFRPIKTAEQIAAEKRESLIDGLLEIIKSNGNGGGNENRRIAHAIYDAGYRLTLEAPKDGDV